MNLPKDKTPIRVIYEYKDGERYEITGEDLENFRSNIESASVMVFAHGGKFKPINWKKHEEKK